MFYNFLGLTATHPNVFSLVISYNFDLTKMVKNKSKLRRTSGNPKKFSRKSSVNTLDAPVEANPEGPDNARTKRFPRNKGESSKTGPSSELTTGNQRRRKSPNAGNSRRFGSGPRDRKGERNEDVKPHDLLDGLPLTRDNMKNFLRIDRTRNKNQGLKWRQGIGSVDMSQYTRTENEEVPHWFDPFKEDEISNDDSSSVNSLEFGGSNPSSEHSSDSTSLDDVCLPEYFEYHNKHPPAEESYHWPDLHILEEFINEELQEHGDVEGKKVEAYEDEPQAEENEQNEQNVYFQDPVAVSLNSKESNNEYGKNFGNTDTTEDTPLLDKALVNEVDVLKQRGQPLRLRPPTVSPWDRSGDKMPAILDKKERRNSRHRPSSHGARPGKVDGKLCRFTYFREDLDQTIHSPSLSGLLVGDSKNLNTEHSVTAGNRENFSSKDRPSKDALDQKARISTLRDLFLPKYYSRKRSQAINNNSELNEISNSNDSNPPQKLSFTSPQDLSESIATNESSRQTFNENVVHPFWLDVLDPSEEEMKVLSKTFRIHPLTTEDIFLGETREKVELFSSYYFVCFTSFDVVYERKKQRAKETEKKIHKIRELQEASGDDGSLYGSPSISKLWNKLSKFWKKLPSSQSQIPHNTRDTLSSISKNKKVRSGELLPLNMYMIIFKDAVITFHFSATPHPVNVRRRARLLRDYLNVSSDWICYALIDDITDSFAPMIESIEDEVNSIEDAILRMHSGDSDDDDDSDEDDEISDNEDGRIGEKSNRDIFYRRQRSKSTVDHGETLGFPAVSGSGSKKSSHSISRSTKSSKVLGWKRKGDLLRRIGECRKRVMSVLRLLGSKADVIRGFSKRFSEPSETNTAKQTLAPSPEIGMYLGDIQDHVVTMVLSLNHYEKLLARSHSNYLAQINIDMTKVNNDTNDVLGKLTILGTIVLPLNVVTGLWGMNCLVPGQDRDDLTWFFSIVFSLTLFSAITYFYLERVLSLRAA